MARILKNYCHTKNQHPQIRQNEFLTHVVNFCLGFAISKGSWSDFSEDPVPVLSPLYKV